MGHASNFGANSGDKVVLRFAAESQNQMVRDTLIRNVGACPLALRMRCRTKFVCFVEARNLVADHQDVRVTLVGGSYTSSINAYTCDILFIPQNVTSPNFIKLPRGSSRSP